MVQGSHVYTESRTMTYDKLGDIDVLYEYVGQHQHSMTSINLTELLQIVV